MQKVTCHAAVTNGRTPKKLDNVHDKLFQSLMNMVTFSSANPTRSIGLYTELNSLGPNPIKSAQSANIYLSMIN